MIEAQIEKEAVGSPPNRRLHRTRRNRRGWGTTTFESCLRETAGAGARISAQPL